MLDVRVSIDGELVAERLTGRAMNVALEQKVVMLEGDRAKRVTVRFERATPPTSEPPFSSERSHHGVPSSAWVVGGIGIAGLLTGTTFGALALSDRSNCDETCGPTRTCNARDVTAMHTKALVADISLGIAAVALVTTAVLVLTRPHEDRHAQSTLSGLLGAPLEF